jgi:hypothetical protein
MIEALQKDAEALRGKVIIIRCAATDVAKDVLMLALLAAGLQPSSEALRGAPCCDAHACTALEATAPFCLCVSYMPDPYTGSAVALA